MKILKRILPDVVISEVSEFDDAKIKKLKEKYHIQGMVLDVDETIRFNMSSIPKKNKEWIKQTLESLKIIVVSNGRDPSIKEYLDSLNIEYIPMAHKPLKKSFSEASKRLKLDSENIIVVGNSLLDDILGGKLSNMKTAWVRPKLIDFFK